MFFDTFGLIRPPCCGSTYVTVTYNVGVFPLREKSMRKIAVLNQKGGVGKTTTVANLGACLAASERRVLMVDMDPQANLSIHYGLELRRGEPSLYTLMTGQAPCDGLARQTEVENLKLIPSNIDLAGLEVELSGQEGREYRLRDALRTLKEPFDYLLIDCPPSLGLLTLNAMCAATEVFIPLQTEFFALQGLSRLLETYELVRSGLNPSLALTGIIACMFDARTSLAYDVLEEIREHFGRKVFKTVIRKNIRLAEAPGFGKPITLYDGRCRGSQDYRALARQVLAMEARERLAACRTDDTGNLRAEQTAPRWGQ